MASSDCRCFLPVKNCIKMHPNWYLGEQNTQDDNLGDKKYFFLGEGLATSTTPTPSTATAPHSLLTKILNTPLPTTLPSLMFASPTAATLSYAYEILLIHRNKHANTCQNTRNHLHGGPHYKTCLQNHLLFSWHTNGQTCWKRWHLLILRLVKYLSNFAW